MSKKDKKPKIPKGKELEYIKQHKKTNYSTPNIKHKRVLQNKINKHINHVETLLDKTNWQEPNSYTNILNYIKKYNLKEYPFTTIKLLIKAIPEYIKYRGFDGEITKKELLQIESTLKQALKSIPQDAKSNFDNIIKSVKDLTIRNKIFQQPFKIDYKIIRWILNQNYYFLAKLCQELGNYDYNYYEESIKYLKEALKFRYIAQSFTNQLLAINYYLLAEYYKKEYFKKEYSKENNTNQSEDENLLAYIKNHKHGKLHYKEYVNEVTESFKNNSIFQENTKKTYYKYRTVNEYSLWSLSTPYIYFANPQELNDPMDLIGLSNIFTSLDPEFTPRVFSMSTNHLNTVMWGHYADGHNGFVIEYCFQEDENFLKQINNLTEVIYQERNEYNINSTEDMLKVDTERKHIHWQYEEEYRFLRFCANGILQHNPNCIKAIYFGLKCSNENQKLIYQILSHHQVKEPIKYFQIILPNDICNLYELKTQEVFWDSKTEEFKMKLP